MGKVGKKPRESGIELLKIFAMLLIVISHTTQTYGSLHEELNIAGMDSYFCDFTMASVNVQTIVLFVFRHFGAFGNDLFFICSAWFLVENNRINVKKLINMIINVWIISVAFFGVFYSLNLDAALSKEMLLSCFFPTTFSNNWYITAYIIFYLAHPFFNMIINNISRKQLFCVCLFFLVVYGVGNAAVSLFVSKYTNIVFFNSAVQFIMIYFFIAYLKKYCKEYTDKVNINVCLLILNILLLVLSILVIDVLGLKFEYFNKDMLFLARGELIFIIFMAASVFFLFKRKVFVNKFINAWSSLTLFIYVIHENVLFRLYMRPYIFVFIKEHFGYNMLILWIIAIAVVLFLASSLVSLIYNKSIGAFVAAVVDKIYPKLCKFNNKLIDKAM